MSSPHSPTQIKAFPGCHFNMPDFLKPTTFLGGIVGMAEKLQQWINISSWHKSRVASKRVASVADTNYYGRPLEAEKLKQTQSQKQNLFPAKQTCQKNNWNWKRTDKNLNLPHTLWRFCKPEQVTHQIGLPQRLNGSVVLWPSGL